MQKLVELYKQWKGEEPQDVVRLTAGGSNREYYRLTDSQGVSVVGCVGTSRDENHAFVYLAKHFTKKQLPVPEILAVSDDELRYIQTDLGNTSLFDAIRGGREAGGRYNVKEVDLLRRTIRELPNIQLNGADELDFVNCYPQPEFDTNSVLFDLNYFKYCFLKLKGVEFNEFKLQQDFEQLADDLLMEQADTFLYRDFQSRNIMLKDGKPYFIDFQGGRRGPIYYDVASFLWQSSAKFSDDVRNLLIEEYLQALQSQLSTLNCQLSTVNCQLSTFRPRLHLFVLFRILQVLGAYGYRGLWEKKAYFTNSIPLAITNLQKEVSLGTCNPYPYLKEVAESLIVLNENEEKSRAEEDAKKAKVAAYLQNDTTYLLSANTSHGLPIEGEMSKGQRGFSLVVNVYSFSFKKGIPADESGNGGGYVFDCRSTHNPGRYEEYKPLTGLDQPVIDFLEADGEILTFLESVYRLVDFHVARFQERGFTHLQISFGCTGGRHRSVYCAQHVAEHIHEKFGVEVHICHREQNITEVLK